MGFKYVRREADKLRAQEWRKKLEETVYCQAVKGSGKVHIEKLANTEEQLLKREMHEGRRVENVLEQQQSLSDGTTVNRQGIAQNEEVCEDGEGGMANLDFDDPDVKYQVKNVSSEQLEEQKLKQNEQQVSESDLTPSPLSVEDLLATPRQAPNPIPEGDINLCFRCHEIIYHSRPTPLGPTPLPPSPSLPVLLSSVAKTNPDPNKPPVYVHVIDVADFPLSFVPFQPLGGGKVLFVVNRADAMCERASSMGFLRVYFKREIAKILTDEGIVLENEIEVHPVSAKKGYGIEALLNRIFQLRNAHSNVYFIGIIPNLGLFRR